MLIGLGGRERSHEHALRTAAALNRMQPPFLAALRFIPVPGTRLAGEIESGRFAPVSEREAAEELRALLANLELEHTLFRANHASNIIPLGGRFPRDRETLLSRLDELLASGRLDDTGPGAVPLWL